MWDVSLALKMTLRTDYYADAERFEIQGEEGLPRPGFRTARRQHSNPCARSSSAPTKHPTFRAPAIGMSPRQGGRGVIDAGRRLGALDACEPVANLAEEPQCYRHHVMAM